uniref:Uncharacterized protein n=1 Tax=Heterorhabditis bacteriophora TaxID=37862 RepID=A0A1I7WQT5_HETBA
MAELYRLRKYSSILKLAGYGSKMPLFCDSPHSTTAL